jgi:GNAT superfamily N-acetyltransferase
MIRNVIAATAVRRTNQVLFEQVSQRETIDCGYAYTSTVFPRIPLCNFMGEVLIDNAAVDPYAAVERYYGQRGLTCSRWIPSAEQDPGPVGVLLAPHGFVRRETITMALPADARGSAEERFKMLGARAMRNAYTRVIRERSAAFPDLSDDLTAVQLERLNDPQYDAFVAMVGDDPVGVGALFQAGDIGRVCDVYVVEAHRRRGIGQAIFGYLLMTARRWALRPICAAVDAANLAGRRLLAKAGFEEGGLIVSFVRPGTAECWE